MEKVGREVAVQPGMKARQWLGSEPFLIHRGELSYKRDHCSVGEAASRPVKLATSGKARIKLAQEHQPTLAMLKWVVFVPLRVFVAIKISLKALIVRRDQGDIVTCQPALGIASGQRPAHDIEALVDDGVIWQD